MMSQSNFDLYRVSNAPLIGAADSANWGYPGTACTANFVKLWPGLMPGTKIKYARWVIAWNPSTDAHPTQVRLIAATDGPTIFDQLALISVANYRAPKVDGADITAALQAIWDNPKLNLPGIDIGHQTTGNGVNGPLIYASWLEVVFQG